MSPSPERRGGRRPDRGPIRHPERRGEWKPRRRGEEPDRRSDWTPRRRQEGAPAERRLERRPGRDEMPRRPGGPARFERERPRRAPGRDAARVERPSFPARRDWREEPVAPQESEVHAAAAPADLIWGRHSAVAALESGRPIHRVWCTPEMRFSPRFLQLLREAKSSGVLIEEVTWARLGQISGGAVHQGIVLQPAAAETLDLPTLIEGCRGLGEPPLLIAVDGLTDPQNLGAIVRSAEALGAHGMVLPQRRNAGLTGSVAKVAAGALEHLPVARVVNLNRSLEALKQEGYRVIGLAEQGSVCLEEADLEGPLVVVTGSEGQGLSMLTRRSCDQLVRIPLRGATPSLNASVATALLLYEVARRGWMRGLRGSAPAPRVVRPSFATEPAPYPESPPAAPAADRAVEGVPSESGREGAPPEPEAWIDGESAPDAAPLEAAAVRESEPAGSASEVPAAGTSAPGTGDDGAGDDQMGDAEMGEEEMREEEMGGAGTRTEEPLLFESDVSL